MINAAGTETNPMICNPAAAPVMFVCLKKIQLSIFPDLSECHYWEKVRIYVHVIKLKVEVSL